jgi:hypothetical protein
MNPAERLNNNNFWSGLSDRQMNRTYSCTTVEDNISGQDEELNSVQSESESTRACSDVNNVSRDQQQAIVMNKTNINSDEINLPREDLVHSKTQVSVKNIKYNLNNDKRTNTQQKQNKNIQRTGISNNGMTSQSKYSTRAAWGNVKPDIGLKAESQNKTVQGNVKRTNNSTATTNDNTGQK